MHLWIKENSYNVDSLLIGNYIILVESFVRSPIWPPMIPPITWSNKAQPQEQSPFQLFCKRNIDHPDCPILISAMKEQRVHQADEVMRQMSRDGWRKYLASVSRTDARPILRYLAKADGRKPKSIAYSGEALLKGADGVREFTSHQKCCILADYLEE